MSDHITLLSEFIIRNPEIMNFTDLLSAVGRHGKEGATMLKIDIKPDYRDTPRNWENQIEIAFTWGER